MAPVGHTWPQLLQLGSQPDQLGTACGVQRLLTPPEKLIGCSTSFGHALKHSPQRIHNCKKSLSGTLPGGRITGVAEPRAIGSGKRTAVAMAAPAAMPVSSPRRENLISRTGGSFSSFSSEFSQRSTNLIACVGQTPPQV